MSARGRQPLQSFTLINLLANLLHLGEGGGGLERLLRLIQAANSYPPPHPSVNNFFYNLLCNESWFWVWLLRNSTLIVSEILFFLLRVGGCRRTPVSLLQLRLALQTFLSRLVIKLTSLRIIPKLLVGKYAGCDRTESCFSSLDRGSDPGVVNLVKGNRC